jgi:hypothetical protein
MRAISTLTKEILEGRDQAEVLADYQCGKLPELDNVQAQMAMVELTEMLGGSLKCKQIGTEESVGTVGLLQNVGIHALCKSLVFTPVSVEAVQQCLNPSLFASQTTSKCLAKCHQTYGLQKQEPKEVVFKDLSSTERSFEAIKKIQAKEVLNVRPTEAVQSFEVERDLHCKVLLALALRLCLPLQVETALGESQGKSNEEKAGEAVKVIKRCVELQGLQETKVVSLLLPIDFKVEPITTDAAVEKTEREGLVRPLVPQRCQRVEEARRSRDLAKRSIKIIHETLASEQSAPVESVLQLEELKDPEVQVALTRVAGNFLPLAIIQEILPSGLTSDTEDFDETVGTQLILQLLGSDHHQVEELTACLDTENFSKKELGKVRRLLRSVSSEVLSAPPPLEVATVSKKALNRGISVIRNIVLHQDEELNVEEIVKYFSVRRLEGFDRPDVQMAFLTVAKRISSPHHVETLVAEELHENNRNQLSLLGFKVLVGVAQMNPYQIESIERFLLPGDLAPSTTQQAVAWVEEISQQMAFQQAEERATIAPFSHPLTLNPKLLMESLTSREESWERAVNMVEQLRQVDCIPGQAKLLGLACNLSSPPEVYRVLASEILTQENLLPVVGAFALCKIVEELALTKEQIITLTEPLLGVKKGKGYEEKIVWHNVASFIQLPQQHWGKTASLPQRRQMFEKALVETVQNINQEIVESDAHALLSTSKIPPEMEELKSQLVLLSVSERLTGISMLEQPAVSESVGSPTWVSSLGVRALASAIQLCGLKVASQVPSILHAEDLKEDEAKHRLGTLLCLAHSHAVKVSALTCTISCFVFLYSFEGHP